MIRSPKERFIASASAPVFRKMATSFEFEEAVVAAMIEMERDMPMDCSPNQAADAHNQMVGARKYLDKLVTIYQPEVTSEETTHPTLNYEHGV